MLAARQAWITQVPLRRRTTGIPYTRGEFAGVKVGDCVYTISQDPDSDGEFNVWLTQAQAERADSGYVFVDKDQLTFTRPSGETIASLEPVAERVSETVTLTREVVKLKLSNEEAVAVGYMLVRATGDTEMTAACRRVLAALLSAGVEIPPQSAGLSEGTVQFE